MSPSPSEESGGLSIPSKPMKWSVTYRGEDGGLASMLVDANSRDAVFKALAEKRIRAIRVEIARGSRPAIGVPPFPKVIGYLLGGIALAGGTGIVCALVIGSGRGGGEPGTSLPEKPRVETVITDIATNRPRETAEGETPRDPNIISIRKTVNPFTGEEMLFTNRHKKVKANAGVIGRDFPNNRYRPKRKLFKHYSENYICGLMRTPLGMPIVRGRLPKNFDEDFAKSYADEIRMEPEDTEEDIALKRAMIDFKEEVRGLIANGASVSQIVLDAREEQNSLAEYRKDMMRTIADLRRGGATREMLNEAREAANIMLDSKGLKRIPAADLPRKGEE